MSETMKLVLSRDRQAKDVKALLEVAWYKNEFGDHMVDSGRKQVPGEFVDEVIMYDQDAETLVKTNHEKWGSS